MNYKPLHERLNIVERVLCDNAKTLEQEQDPFKISSGQIVQKVFFKIIALLTSIPPCVICLPLYLLTRCFYDAPPYLPSLEHVCFVQLWGCFFGQRYVVNIPIWERFIMFCDVLLTLIRMPKMGFYHMLDKILYKYEKMDIGDDPIILLQAARVGSTSFSTQLYSILEDECIGVDCMIRMKPYIWYHKIFLPYFKRQTRAEYHKENFCLKEGMSLAASEYKKRHQPELDAPDTLEPFLQGQMRAGYTTCPTEGSREFLERFVSPSFTGQMLPVFLDLLKKTKYLYDPNGDKRIMFKTHSIELANEFARLYPNAKFINMTRSQNRDVRSLVNYIYSHPAPRASGFQVPVEHIAIFYTLFTMAYREKEAAFYKKERKRKITFQFKDWVSNNRKVLTTALNFLEIEVSKKKKKRIKSAIHLIAKKRKNRCYQIDLMWKDLWKDVDVVHRLLKIGLHSDLYKLLVAG